MEKREETRGTELTGAFVQCTRTGLKIRGKDLGGFQWRFPIKASYFPKCPLMRWATRGASTTEAWLTKLHLQANASDSCTTNNSKDFMPSSISMYSNVLSTAFPSSEGTHLSRASRISPTMPNLTQSHVSQIVRTKVVDRWMLLRGLPASKRGT